MTYALGVDLGTTYTAAAIHRDGRTATVDLGNRSAAIPSVVFLRDDETILTGDAANRRGTTEPGRVAREFKRRFGDTTPILLGGAPYSADALMSKLLRWVVDTVGEREGSSPARLAVAHPANWGPYKLDLLRQTIARADLDHVATVTEPEAAVTYYATLERVEPGAVIAVYDLGGGTFDAAVVRKTATGVELLGTPEGIERFGGIDFDEAVFSHVAASLGGALDQLDPNDGAAVAAVARLRAECVEAKEALSTDTQVSIPVLLPNVSTEVRLTRTELEAMIRPPLADTMVAMRRALRSAGVTSDQLTAVLLAGGSSRIPLVAQMVGAELGRPVAVDAHPKYGVALGAALVAAGAGQSSAAVDPGPGLAAAAAAGAVFADPNPTTAVPITATTPAAPTAIAPVPPSPPPAGPPQAPPPSVPLPAAYTADGPPDGRSRRPLLIVLAALVIAAIGVGAVFLLTRDDEPAVGAGGTTTTATSATSTTTASATTGATAAPTAPTTAATSPPTTTPPVCPADDPRLCIEITSIAVDGDSLVIDWDPSNFEPSVDDFHAHFFWNTTRPQEAGTNAAEFGASQGAWELTDQRPFRSEGEMRVSNKPDAATEVCVTPANQSHGVVDPTVVHCVPLPG
jgi:actin-like ATPase involved in cell morphogenesis